eukprot:jgi/Tetstr1/441856/TSEL_030068.t1
MTGALGRRREAHATLLERIASFGTSGYGCHHGAMRLLVVCAVRQTGFLSRMMPPPELDPFLEAVDAANISAAFSLLGLDACDQSTPRMEAAIVQMSMPADFGGLNLALLQSEAPAAFYSAQSVVLPKLVREYGPALGPLYEAVRAEVSSVATSALPWARETRRVYETVERAPEPTNVQFEHLGVRAAARLWRGATTWAWLILTLAVGFVLLSLTVSFKVEDAERGGGVGTQHAMLWVGVLVVLSTNLALWWLGLRAASHEAHPTFSEQRSAATLKLSVALIASTIFLALAANILAPLAASAGFSPTFLGGVFPDFTPRWYHEVGLTLFVTVLACAAFAAARPAALAFVSASRRRRADMAVIQCDMNAAFKGPSWDMRVRQALHSAVLATVLIFGSALPLLYVGGLLYFTIAY